jgi:hypothetical protein
MTLISADPDTNRLLEVVAWVLAHSFGHPDGAAHLTVRSFYARNLARYDDDFYHHEGPFRSAAIIHYASTREGWNVQGFVEWLRGQDFRREQAEALEYYRKYYFDKR